MKFNRAAVIIIKRDKILLMHRFKQGQEYWVIPGGTIEPGETPEQTAIREIKEETNLDIEIDEIFCTLHDQFHCGVYYIGKNPDGMVKLGGPEAVRQSDENFYSPKWVVLKDVKELTLYPKEIKKKIIDVFCK